MEPDRRRSQADKRSTELAAHRICAAWADLAQPIGIKCVRQEHADADEDEECRHDLGHSLPPCVAMPRKGTLEKFAVDEVKH